jgi:hypothetical protein
MKFHLALAYLAASLITVAEKPASEKISSEHQEAAAKIADQQDELAADVQQLTIEQTVPQVIELLDQVKSVMDEATDQLLDSDTGGATIAAQTEIIEKIHAAAQEKQKQQGGSSSGGAMMDMMERMMGKKSEGAAQKGAGEGAEAGDQAGKGGKGASDAANSDVAGALSSKDETRRIPKASGSAGRVLPEEFQQALDAYNRGAEQQVK